jgi:hypothetical protein
MSRRGSRAKPRDLSDEIAERWEPDRLLRFVSRRAGRGERLDAATRAHFEARLGVDLGHVRVFRGELAEEVTRAQGAEAVTVGTTGMILMSGSPDRSPATSQGRALLAHELTHVAQATRALHRAARFGETPPLATEEHEEEAELIESQELSGSPAPAEDPSARERRKQEVRDAIVERVVELLDEDARVRGLRGGASGRRY